MTLKVNIDFLELIKNSFENRSFSFKDFIDDETKRGGRIVNYIFIIRDNNVNKNIKEGKIIFDQPEWEFKSDEDYLNQGRIELIKHSLLNLTDTISVQIKVGKNT